MENVEVNASLTPDMLVYLSGASILMMIKAKERDDSLSMYKGVQVLERLAVAADAITD